MTSESATTSKLPAAADRGSICPPGGHTAHKRVDYGVLPYTDCTKPPKRQGEGGIGTTCSLRSILRALRLDVVELLSAEEQDVDRSRYLTRTRRLSRAPDRVHGEPARPRTARCRIRYQDFVLPGAKPNDLAIQRSPITFQLSVHAVLPDNHELAEG
jgi:hypothetical protein